MLIKKFYLAPLYTLLVLPLVSCGTEMGDQIAAGGIIGTGENGVEVSLEPSGVNDLVQNKKIVSIGTVTALDGVTVNGTRYETSKASILHHGSEVENKEGYLALGMVVEVRGTVKLDRKSGEAEVITVNEILEGPLSEVDTTAGTFVIFGRTVHVSGETVYNLLPEGNQGGLSGLIVDKVYEVSGFEDGSGNVVATRIEQKGIERVFEFTGSVSNLDRTNSSFRIGTLIVNYLNAVFKHFEEKPLQDGDLVEVKGEPSGESQDTFNAAELELKKLRHSHMSEDDEYEVEGIIGSIDGSTLELHYGGGKTRVIFGKFTNFENGLMKDLAVGKKAEIEGFFVNGDLKAGKISFKNKKNHNDDDNEKNDD